MDNISGVGRHPKIDIFLKKKESIRHAKEEFIYVLAEEYTEKCQV